MTTSQSIPTSLKGIEFFPNLTKLICYDNELTELDVSKNKELKYLDCDRNQLTSLQVDNCTKLGLISCYDNKYSVQVYESTRILDPGTLPGNFDISRVGNLVGADKTADGKLKVRDGASTVTYEYSPWSDYYHVIFTLNVEFIPEGSIVIDASNFPDPEFQKYLETATRPNTSTKIDQDQNGILSEDERNAVREIDVSKKNISNLSGIEFFPNLRELACYDNQLTSLDVSQHPELQRLQCSKNNLTSLDVSQNPALWILLCSGNQLTSLDVSQNLKLRELDCKNNQLTNLNVENTSIDLSDPSISRFEAQNNTYSIAVGSNRTFDLSTLPGFDVTKATNWSGGTVSGKTLKVNEGEN